MKRILFIAQFPPPIHGLSKAVDTLYNSHLNELFSFQSVNIMENKRIMKNLLKIATAKTDAFYFTISQTRGGLWRDIVLMMLIAMRRKPMIIHLHGGYLRTLIDRDCGVVERWLAKEMIGKAACCIVLGDSLRYIFKGIVDDKKIAVVPNCVDNEYLLPAELMGKKKKEIENTEVLHVLYLSNFIATKGYREVLEMAKMLKDKGEADKFRFHFAGKFFEKEEKNFYDAYVSENHLDGMVGYHGIVSGDAKRHLLRLCNIFMLLTRYPNEGQPISILEAMGNGMSIVTTNHAGIPDIANKNNGFVCDRNCINVDNIVDYLIDCYSNRENLLSVSSNNYNIVCDKFKQNKYLERMYNIFSQAGGGKMS